MVAYSTFIRNIFTLKCNKMNYQNQNSPNPDYGFILNQQSLPQKPKKNKKVIVLVIALICLGIITIVSVIFGGDSSKRNAQTASSLPTKHMVALSRKDYTGAYQDMSTRFRETYNEPNYETKVTGVLAERIDFASCKSDTSKQLNNAEAFTCLNSDHSLKLTLMVVTVLENDKLRIDRYAIVSANRSL